MTILAFWRAVAERLAAGESVFVALVVANTRGSPGTLGARALVDRQGCMQGTIGGGIMETRMRELARDAFAWPSYRPRIQRLVHRRDAGAEASGLICAGEQTNLYAVLAPDRHRDQIADFVTAIEREDETAATLAIDAYGLYFATGAPDLEQSSPRLIRRDDRWCYLEDNISRRRLVIVGAGHCGRALAQLAVGIGHRVEVFDIRADVFAAGDWPPDVRCHVLSDYAALEASLARVERARVVVMTTAVTHDIEALTVLASRDCRWLGVMGSRHKIHAIRAALQERGVDNARIDAVRGPIGLVMKSDTPAEIAVSIMGELLAHERDGALSAVRGDLHRSGVVD